MHMHMHAAMWQRLHALMADCTYNARFIVLTMCRLHSLTHCFSLCVQAAQSRGARQYDAWEGEGVGQGLSDMATVAVPELVLRV